MLKTRLILGDEVYAIVGALMDVHTHLGPAFLEAVYQEAVAIEFRLRSLPFEAQKPLHIRYKGIVLEKTYVADFVCFEKVIIEIKAQEKLTTRDEAQILNYLAATGFEVGVLANFGALGQLEFKRFVK